MKNNNNNNPVTSSQDTPSVTNSDCNDSQHFNSDEQHKEYLKLCEEQKEFGKLALLSDTEEFEFSLANGWINENLIPNKLAITERSQLRNSNGYLIKLNVNQESIICLRYENNSIKTEKITNLVEV